MAEIFESREWCQTLFFFIAGRVNVLLHHLLCSNSNNFARDSIDFTWRTQRDDGEEVAAFQCRLFVQSSFFSNYLLLSLVSCVRFFFKLFSCRPVSLHCAMSNLRRQPVVDRLTILSKRRNNNKDCKCTSLLLFIFSRVLSVQLISDDLPINPNPEQHKQLPDLSS